MTDENFECMPAKNIVSKIIKSIKCNGNCIIYYKNLKEVKIQSLTFVENYGDLALEKLVEGMKNQFTLDFQDFVEKYNDIFTVDISKNGILLINLNLNLCKDYESKLGCKNKLCTNLHICKFYLLGKCEYDNYCHFSHNINDHTNRSILRKLLLQNIDIKELLNILKSNNVTSIQLIPLVCRFYNKSTGCNKNNKCHAMHICYHYMLNDCKFNKKCNFSHNIYDKQPLDILKKYNINVARSPKLVIEELRKFIKLNSNDDEEFLNISVSPIKNDFNDNGKNNNRNALKRGYSNTKNDSSDDDNDSNGNDSNIQTIQSKYIIIEKKLELCTFQLRDKCSYKENCIYMHSVYKLPFLWRWMRDNEWINFSESECKFIEHKYCDVYCDTAEIFNEIGKFKIDFINDKNLCYILNLHTFGQVQRIGTRSQSDSKTNYEFLTNWKWFVRDESLHWNFINDMPDLKIDNYDLEEYRNKNITEISEKYNIYSISYSEMKMKMKNGNILNLKRRPILYKPENQLLIKLDRNICYPSTWSFDAISDNDFYQTVEINRTGATAKEFEEIEYLFSLSVKYKIKSIYRIQNAQLWDSYQTKKKWMNIPNEKRLFHVTKPNIIDAICQQGFDWRLAGNSAGTAYGNGSYFSINAIYCDKNYKRFTRSNQSINRKMIIAKVLVGKFTRGNESYIKPPPISNSKDGNQLYDSCVDDIHNPTKFVIFEHNQSYPEYVITYDKTIF